MSDNPFTKAISRTNRRPQTPAPKPHPKGKVVKQSTTKIEYRDLISTFSEKYLGACNHPFTKSQYEALVKSPKLPPTFLSIRASLPKNGDVCLYASSVFGGAAVKGLIGKLKTSCTAAAGKGSKAACNELIADLNARIKKAPSVATQKLPDQFDPSSINPFGSKFWIHLAQATIGGAGFGIGMGGVNWIWGKVTGKSLTQRFKDFINNRNGNGDGTGKTGGDSTSTSTSSAADTGSKMVAGALGVAAVLVDKLDDIEFPPVPIVPAMDTIDQNYILDPNSAAQAAYNGMTAAAWSEVARPTSYVISWAAALAALDSFATSVEDLMRPHHPTNTNTWADRNISDPMAQAGRNMATSILAAKAKIIKQKPENMPAAVFAGLVIITAPLWIPALAINSLGSLFMGPALQEMMDKRPGNRRTPGPA